MNSAKIYTHKGFNLYPLDLSCKYYCLGAWVYRILTFFIDLFSNYEPKNFIDTYKNLLFWFYIYQALGFIC